MSVVEFCVSSRWGFSCFPPRSKALIDLSGGRLAPPLTTASRFASRGTLACAALWICHATAQELGSTFRECSAKKGQPAVIYTTSQSDERLMDGGVPWPRAI